MYYDYARKILNEQISVVDPFNEARKFTLSSCLNDLQQAVNEELGCFDAAQTSELRSIGETAGTLSAIKFRMQTARIPALICSHLSNKS